MTETIVLDGDLAAAVRAEADLSFGGDAGLLTRRVLEDHLALQRIYQQLAGGGTEPQQLARAVAGIPGLSLEGAQAAASLVRQAMGEALQLDEGTPAQHVAELVAFAASGIGHMVGVGIITSQPAGGAPGSQREGITSYARGWLTLHGNPPGRGLAGDLDQWFSDRVHGYAAAPFDPDRSERIGVLIAMDETTGLVSAEITAHAWGDARQTLQNLRMDNGVLVGDGASVGNQSASALYALSLSRVVAPG